MNGGPRRRSSVVRKGSAGMRTVLGSELAGGVEGNKLVVVVAVAGPDVGVETERSEVDDVCLKDRQTCAIKLTAVRRGAAGAPSSGSGSGSTVNLRGIWSH